MQKRITWVVVLMSCCVLGITGLQLHWNYQNYQNTVQIFQKEANNALILAVNKEQANRRQQFVSQVKHWLADTSLIVIESNRNNRDSATVFTIRDAHPRFTEDTSRRQKIYEFGINSFHKKLNTITPSARTMVINHFAERTFMHDIENGTVYYYTQALGDSINKMFNQSKVDPKLIASLYKKELFHKGIYTFFRINPNLKSKIAHYSTDPINASLMRPYGRELVWAELENPSSYFMREMRSLIFTSILLIAITFFCFFYTLKTLFNQHKLVALKDQFISNMTHEIHTPLSSIQITAEALKSFDHDGPTRENYLSIILFQTKKLTALTQEILAQAKLEKMGIDMDERIHINELIKEVVIEFDRRDKRNIKFSPSIQSNTIQGNKTHLKRAFLNILENAFKYNTSAGAFVEIKMSRQDETLTLSFSDNGPGIDDKYKQKVFEQFYRIPSGNVHNVKGYGLGLSYVKRVISQHQGNIRIGDRHPNGCVFFVTFKVNG